jgi:predicted phage baseplate assembly protein
VTLAVPRLDDRRFQDIVDEAKGRIQRYCPEWTDHNVSDPGVALIELFAWMTDLLLYRVNQVPDKIYVKFLELMGMRLDPPRAARAPVTFYLSAPQATDLKIPEGTEVATVRTETSSAIVFTTEADLIVRTATLKAILTGPGSDDAQWLPHDVRRLEFPDHPIAVFSPEPAEGDALYFVLERDHTRHVLAVRMACDIAAGAGVDPVDPPLVWQVWHSDDVGWAPCEVEYDGTRALNVPGEIVLHMPPMAEKVLAGQRGFWLRCLLTPVRAGQRSYYKPPFVSQLRVEARGGTVDARHAVTVRDEILGRSEGTPGQTFTLLNTPILARDIQRDHLLVESSPEVHEVWTEVADFAESGEEDLHYTLDELTGELTLGPSLLQPDGGVYRFGAIPAKGSRLRMARYQHGGGVAGNAPRGALSVLKSSIPYVARVVNRAPAEGGRNPQSLEDAKLRAPHLLRSRTRAVTEEDFEHIATQVNRVGRAYCLAPSAVPGGANDPRPGHVVVLVLPQVDSPDGPIAPAQLALTPDLANAVQSRLDAHRLLGTTLEVRQPRYVWVTVGVTLRFAAGTDPAAMEDARAHAQTALYRYLNPFIGGPQKEGWPLGRDLNRSELYGLLQQVPHVEYAEDLRLTVAESEAAVVPLTSAQHIVVPFDALVCSGRHQVGVDLAVNEG